MAHNSNKQKNKKTAEIKQNFLSSAISDISSCIQLIDTKVSIIIGAVVAILAGIAACYEPIGYAVKNIAPSSWIGILFIFFTILGLLNIILVFVFGILTVKGHSCIINYKSKWFLSQSTKEYSFDEFTRDIQRMNDNDIIINIKGSKKCRSLWS